MHHLDRRVAALIAFVTSAAVLVMEIVASRLLAPYVGVTLQTYTAIIGVVLAGISLGAWLGGRLADRGDPVRSVSLTLMAAGGLVFASLALLRFAAWLFTNFGARLYVNTPPLQAVLLVVFAFLPPATVASMVSPLLVKASLQDLNRTGREVGRLSAIGTAGAIVGTFIAGFLLVATIPSPTILLIVGVLLVLMGAGLWASTRSRLSMGSNRVPLAMFLVAGGLGGTVPLHHTPCDVETAYFCASVIQDTDRIRILQLDTLMHSAVDLKDDRKLIFEYTQSIGAAIDTHWSTGVPIRGIHIGGGGFSIPRYVRTTRPGSYNLVIERDPAVIKLDKDKLGLVTSKELVARSEDGRVAMRLAKPASYDLVVGDAFGGEAVPWHLATKEFTKLVKRTLKLNGMYALNVIDGAPAKFARAEVATVMSVFPYVAVVTPSEAFTGAAGANYIVLAATSELGLAKLAAEHDRTGLRVEIRSGASLLKWVGSAKVLTDAFAPVDQLLTVES
jgi:spermidine synthase/MFS family permease